MKNHVDAEYNNANRRTIHNIFPARVPNKIKSVASHVGLLIALMFYTVVGGLVFREIELPAELSRLEQMRGKLRARRNNFVQMVSNNTDVSNFDILVGKELYDYEEAVEEAVKIGLPVDLMKEKIDRGIIEFRIATEKWSLFQAIFFASTILTTIGYGNVVPLTNVGRMFCILFAFIGIPLTLIVIADWGKLFAKGVIELGLIVKSRLFSQIHTKSMSNKLGGKKWFGAIAAIILLFFYLACGAGMFMLWEEDWDFFEGFYFCFVTMTTIGFGDIVPKQPKYTLLCTLYILVGLATTSTIIELVRRQYTQSWKRLQALSGPLADAIKKLGESAGGDVAALHSDLRKVLTVITMPRLKWTSGRGESKDKEWEEAVEAVLRDIAAATVKSTPPKKSIVQIVVYESSQLSIMTGIKDPTIPPPVENENIEENGMICTRRLFGLPVFTSVGSFISNSYTSIKTSHDLITLVFDNTENQLNRGLELISPFTDKIADILETPLKTVDCAVCVGLDFFDKKIPSTTTLPSTESYDNLFNYIREIFTSAKEIWNTFFKQLAITDKIEQIDHNISGNAK